MGSSSQASLAVTQGMSMHPTRPCPHRSVPEGLLGTEGVLAPALSQDTWRGGRLWHGPRPSGPEPVLPWHRESPGRAMPPASLVLGTTHTHGRRGHSDSAAHSCAALATCISVSLPRPSPVAVPRLQNRDHATPGARWEGGMAHARPVPGTWNALSVGRPHDHFSVSCRAVPPMSPAGSTHWGFSLVETSGRASSNLVCPGLWLSCSLTPHRPLPPE